jgi:hypothetical protein
MNTSNADNMEDSAGEKHMYFLEMENFGFIPL